MSIATPALFTIATIAAFLTIWKSVAAALPAIRALRAQLAEASQVPLVQVATLNTRSSIIEETAVRSARLRRHLHPKPVTHRLHQFPHRAHAA
ncbi:hypothetical protein [Novosphingobium sp. P6W]|uniref:hypothetical protein n=1 Tax=Novosphingobium sp. P6W TaxID=1609758 RepID=UPI0005C3150C|nr:hypothetical protein [Novosphingobium sp. P6W]AXB77154.1 hypothetical protein TQ38_012165 [Novosphingobium sp. P6W]KIS30893.1 hypothetical protein TQ38_20020 [Novosphingobium sp. P6W]